MGMGNPLDLLMEIHQLREHPQDCDNWCGFWVHFCSHRRWEKCDVADVAWISAMIPWLPPSCTSCAGSRGGEALGGAGGVQTSAAAAGGGTDAAAAGDRRWDHQGSSGIIGGLVLFLFWLRGTTRYIQIPPVCICKQWAIHALDFCDATRWGETGTGCWCLCWATQQLCPMLAALRTGLRRDENTTNSVHNSTLCQINSNQNKLVLLQDLFPEFGPYICLSHVMTKTNPCMSTNPVSRSDWRASLWKRSWSQANFDTRQSWKTSRPGDAWSAQWFNVSFWNSYISVTTWWHRLTSATFIFCPEFPNPSTSQSSIKLSINQTKSIQPAIMTNDHRPSSIFMNHHWPRSATFTIHVKP